MSSAFSGMISGGAASPPSLQIGVQWDSLPPFPTVLSAEEATEISSLCRRLQRATHSAEDMERLGAHLAAVLFPGDAGLRRLFGAARARGAEIRLTCPADDQTGRGLLVRWPWEAALLPADEGGPAPAFVLARTLAGQAVVRVLPGVAQPPAATGSRPRLLWTVSYPTEKPQLAIKPREFDQAFQDLQKRCPLLDVAGEPDANRSFRTVRQLLREHSPHVAVVLAHGTTQAGSPKIAFADGERALTEAASLFAGVRLVVLICCDLVGGQADDTALVGAACVLDAGAGAVIAMQGTLFARDAADFLHALLQSIVSGHTLPEAVALARDAIPQKRKQMAFLPALFAGQAGTEAGANLGAVLQAYRACIVEQFQDLPAERYYFPRTGLEQQLAGALAGTGLCVLRGESGAGTTHALGHALRRQEVERGQDRPFIYVDFDQQEAVDHVAVLKKTLREKFSATSFEAIVGRDAGQEPSFRTGEEVAARIHEAKISLCLDHLPAARSAGDEHFWKGLVRGADSPHGEGLILLVNPPASVYPATNPALDLPFLNENETRAFTGENLPAWSSEAAGIWEFTSGSLLLLDLLKCRYDERDAAPMSFENFLTSPAIAARYFSLTMAGLTDEEFDDLSALAWIHGPWDAALVRECYLDSAGNFARLQRLGLLQPSVQEGAACYTFPAWKRRTWLEAGKEGIDASGAVIAAKFVNQPEAQRIAIVGKLLAAPGGRSILQAIQHACLASGVPEAASWIAFIADAGAASMFLLQLYLALENAGVATPGEKFRMLELRAALGKHAEALAQMESIRPEDFGDALLACRYLKVRAVILKDTRQGAAVEEIRHLYKQAIIMAEDRLRARPDDDWKRLLSGLLQNQLAFLLFLDPGAVPEVGEILDRIASLEREGFANALGECVERELKLPPAAVDWNRVARRLLEAQKLLEHSQNFRNRAYVQYEYGQYLRKMPGADPAAALEAYAESEHWARRAQEPRRVALAVYRRIELTRKKADPGPADEALDALEAVLAPLRDEDRDALGLRALARVYLLRGEIAEALPEHGQLAVDSFKGACSALALPAVNSATDHGLFRKALSRCLRLLRERQAFRQAQNLVFSLEAAIGTRLGRTVNFQDPWALIEHVEEPA